MFVYRRVIVVYPIYIQFTQWYGMVVPKGNCPTEIFAPLGAPWLFGHEANPRKCIFFFVKSFHFYGSMGDQDVYLSLIYLHGKPIKVHQDHGSVGKYTSNRPMETLWIWLSCSFFFWIPLEVVDPLDPLPLAASLGGSPSLESLGTNWFHKNYAPEKQHVPWNTRVGSDVFPEIISPFLGVMLVYGGVTLYL